MRGSMRNRRSWLALVLMGALALSGCAADEPESTDAALEPAPTGTSGPQTEEPTANGTADPDPDGSDGSDDADDQNSTEANTPPEASLSASATEVEAGSNITFDLEATDEDGDDLVWTLALDDETVAEGDELPAQVELAFEEAGNYTVVLRVSDGEDEGEASVEVQVQEPEGEAPFEPIDETFMVAGSCFQCTDAHSPAVSVGYTTGTAGIDIAWVELPPSAVGEPFAVESFPVGDPDAMFTPDCSTPDEVEFHGNAGAEGGTVPEGGGCLFMWEWVGSGLEIHVTVG